MIKTILFALACSLLISSTAFLLVSKPDLQASPNVKITKDVIIKWLAYKQKYGLKFSSTDVEIYRMEVFAQNLQIIQNDPSGNLGITFFADLTQEEFAATYLNLIIDQPIINEVTQNQDSDVNISVNFVTAGAVTSVKNQGQCGSNWAFSATGAFESALILAQQANNTIDLSEQQLINCSILNNGCNGGDMNRAFSFIKFFGLTTEANCPYTGTQNMCSAYTQNLYYLSGYKYITAGSVDNLKTALLQRPISVTVDGTNWSLYTNGVFSNCGNSANLGVLLVGFENGAWLVKNSWGTTWGESGYIRLANGNTCGIANAALYPIL